MRKRLLLAGALMLCLLPLFAGGSQEQVSAQDGPIEIFWWHAMGGKLGEKVDAIAAGFNSSQAVYKLIPVNKGSYAETMTAGIAAFRSGTQPHIMQVFEVGTGSMMAAGKAIVPVYELMKRTGQAFNSADYLSTVTGYYTDPKGNMLSMPFNSSTPILYYNKEAFKAAGLDPERPPKTWAEVEAYSKKLVASGAVKAGFTTAWPSWLMIENFSAWHDTPIGTKSNGFEGKDAEFTINNPLVVRHHENLAQWQKEGLFRYGGRQGNADALFSSGEVGMIFNSSAGYAGAKASCDFEFGTGMLPYYDDVKGAPRNSIIGGASLWVMGGHSEGEYKGVAQFLAYLSSPEVQADWHQFTGYLPITYAAYDLSKKQGFYQKNPGTETALLQMTLNAPTANSKGLRFGNFVQIRDVFNSAQESIFSGEKSAQEGLDEAVRQGNALLRKFEADNT
ncbi:MAG: sn-glycerol-3-phosphate ABC transporter substrate-binding protein UgpB [Spirochaetales bacterium]|nr:sn-glycerol-3-phosphate ABC transporter substrate-binding protein UgpB [Spirochaetales bacterium]